MSIQPGKSTRQAVLLYEICDLGWILVHALLRKALETEMGKRN